MKTYKDLVVWQKSINLVAAIYRFCKLLPREEIYGLISQMKRAAVSIPSNIAEGSRRFHQAEQRQFFAIAYGSGAELETQIEICKKLDLLSPSQTSDAEHILDEVMRMLNSLTASRQ